MQDFISKVVSSLGVDMDTAQAATGTLLHVARENLGASDFAKIAEKLDGVDEAIAHSPQEGAPQEGLAGAAQGLFGRAAEALGAEKSGTLGIGALLGLAGLKPDQIPGFVEMFLEYLRQKVGSDVVAGLLGKLPGLLDLKSGDVAG